MADKKQGWDSLNEKARRYVAIYQESGGHVEISDDKILDTRTEEQIILASQIVAGAERYIQHIAEKLLYSSFTIRNKLYQNGANRISLHHLSGVVLVDELVGYGSIGILSDLHKFNPDYSISSFIRLKSAVSMYNSALDNDLDSIGLGRNKLTKCLKEVRSSGSAAEALEMIDDVVHNTEKAALILYCLTRKYASTHPHLQMMYAGKNPMPIPLCDFAFPEDLGHRTSISDQAENNIFIERLDNILATLTEREELVLRKRFGLYDNYPMTLQEVGDIINTSHSRVRQIEAKALRKLRHPSRAKTIARIMPYDDIHAYVSHKSVGMRILVGTAGIMVGPRVDYVTVYRADVDLGENMGRDDMRMTLAGIPNLTFYYKNLFNATVDGQSIFQNYGGLRKKFLKKGEVRLMFKDNSEDLEYLLEDGDFREIGLRLVI